MSLGTLTLQPKASSSKLKCPYCHGEPSGRTVECRGCEATHHEECFTEHRGCAAGHCDSVTARSREAYRLALCTTCSELHPGRAGEALKCPSRPPAPKPALRPKPKSMGLFGEGCLYLLGEFVANLLLGLVASLFA